MRPVPILLAGIVAVFGLAMFTGGGAMAAGTVLCHDPERDSVSRLRSYDCDGRIVSEEEAAAIEKRRRDYVRRAVNSAKQKSRPDGIGTGFFVSGNGDVLTNRHVVENCKTVSILTPGGDRVKATLVSSSGLYDLALLRTGARPKKTAVIDPASLKEGAKVTITGFPVRKLPRVRPLAMHGMYLGTHRAQAAQGVLVLAAKVWLGASGSSVVGETGKVAGMVFARNNGASDEPTKAAHAKPAPPPRTFAIPAQAMLSFLKHRNVTPATGVPSTTPAGFTVRVDCHS